MSDENAGPPEYSAKCSASYLRFVWSDPDDGEEKVRTIDIRRHLGRGSSDFLVAWASFQTLCGIESILKSVDAHLVQLIDLSTNASNAAMRPGQFTDALDAMHAALKRAGIRLPPVPTSPPGAS